MFWNLPNKLTASRIVLIPIFVAAAWLPAPWGPLLSAALFGLAALTDWADGYLARSRKEFTAFGRFLDPVADKLLVISALVLLVDRGYAPGLLVLVIIAREILVMALREFLATGGGVPVSRSGKWKTAFQMTAIVLLLLQDSLFGLPLGDAGLVCLVVAVVLTLWSAYGYVRSAMPRVLAAGGGGEGAG
ncbi:MAG: CDP-diacylglycerol--glycerol-3-phosphate 3-phosphatidyltransferase [Magnetococcus sp. WYHC-3]